MIQLAVKLGYCAILANSLHSRNSFFSTRYRGLRLFAGFWSYFHSQVIDFIDVSYSWVTPFRGSISAYKCSRMQANAWVGGGKIGVRPAIRFQTIDSAFRPCLSSILSKFSFKSSSKITSLKTGSGDRMSTTQGQIKKLKEELAKLRLDYLKAGQDPVAQKQIATMIKTRKSLLSDLGAANGAH